MNLSGKNKKRIVIIGGGISGLATLHYLKIKYYFDQNVDIQLLEKSAHAGGTIRSIERNGCLFETGPNGFLDNKSRTLEFIKELNLEDSVIHADESAKIRYISVNNTLHKFPTNPKDFFSFKLLNALQKLCVLGEIMTPRSRNIHETVYDFGKRRLGKRFAEIFLDPMVSGIYGGDARQTILSAAFPRIHQLEQEYGSLFRAMGKLKKKRKQKTADTIGSPTGTLTSFEKGMTQIVDTLASRYQENIFFNQPVQTISTRQKQYIIYSDNKQHIADEIFLSIPAYEAADLIKGIDQSLAKGLMEIKYAPMAVVGLVFPKDAFEQVPKGFGYLIPSLEKKEVLGVLFDSNIFPQRCSSDNVALRVMIGGIRHKDIVKKSKEDLIQLAQEEINQQFKINKFPCEVFFKAWKRAIPQYDLVYVNMKNQIEEKLNTLGNMHIVANYYKGISFNDCIENAYQVVQKV